ncbi:MAG: PEP-CTERM sorting domain-containing protein [Alphaproteobacteria bacterium]|nr:PEP-CTERM sorting domain-containing protein [Alphaproteobacteria bacterium]
MNGGNIKKRITKRTAALLLGASACLFGALAVSPAAASGITVDVGYVDNLRSSGFFPTVWLGDSNVVSQTPTGQSLDSGAIRIDNNSGGSITVSNFQVFFPSNSSTYAFWNDLVIGNGQTGIFTQTGSYNFDTSDFGIFSAYPPSSLYPTVPGNNLIGGCSSTASILSGSGYQSSCAATIPVISFDIGLTHYVFNDTGHILDTGEWDFVNNGAFGEDGNESINWNTVGSAATRSGTSVPEPLTLTLFGAGLAGVTALRRKRKAR